MIKLLSTTQITASLSTAESEWHALVRTASALIGLQNLAADLGRYLQPILKTDASAAIGIASRRGAGKIRHLATQTLWLQQLVTEKRVKLLKVSGQVNTADLGTKFLDRAKLDGLTTSLGFHVRAGRSPIAKDVAQHIQQSGPSPSR